VSKKWIRNRDWARQPHVKENAPSSLWWFRRPDRHRVVDAYLVRYSRGRALPDGFKDDVLRWLSDLNSLQNKKAWGQPKTFRYWSVPAYAVASGMKPAALMKRLRELEKVAKQLFPDSVPSSRKQRSSLNENEQQEIRKQYLAGEDARELAKKFRITPSQVGHLCRKERAIRDAEREEAQSATPGNAAPADNSESEMPF